MHNKIPEQILTRLQNVSRETICNFVIYEDLLKKWNPTINLVGKSTLDDFWNRHLLDSAQLYAYIPNPRETILADLGSGAGFPGMVLAMMGLKEAHLIESDTRKCEFLRTVSRETGTKVQIHNSRIEDCDLKADIITARALAPLSELISYAKRLSNPNTKYIFLKGENTQAELQEAQKLHNIEYTIHSSISDPRAAVLEIKAGE